MVEAAAHTITWENVAVLLGGRTVLRDFTMCVARGETVGILGPNGAGKSTLLLTVNRFRRPSSGRVTVLGQDLSRLTPSELAILRRRIAYVPQLTIRETGIPLSVLQVVEIARAGRAGLLRRLTPADRQVVQHSIARMGLEALAHRCYSQLSGGEQRKVHLARALAQEPDIILLDEPTNHLDLAWQEELLKEIDLLAQQGNRTILIVTHDVYQLPLSCKKVALLHGGRLLEYGPIYEVLRADILSHVYGRAMEVLRHGGRFHLFPQR